MNAPSLQDEAVLQKIVHTDLYKFITQLASAEPEFLQVLLDRNNGFGEPDGDRDK